MALNPSVAVRVNVIAANKHDNTQAEQRVSQRGHGFLLINNIMLNATTADDINPTSS
jgi:hypothetical protein